MPTAFTIEYLKSNKVYAGVIFPETTSPLILWDESENNLGLVIQCAQDDTRTEVYGICNNNKAIYGQKDIATEALEYYASVKTETKIYIPNKNNSQIIFTVTHVPNI